MDQERVRTHVQDLHPSEEHFKDTYPKILCAPEKENRERENGDIGWRRSSLSWTWAAEIMLTAGV